MRAALALLLLAVPLLPGLCAERPVREPMVFVYGAQSRDAIGQVAEMGANCLYLDTSRENTANMAPLDDRIALAAENGLRTIVVIPTLQHSFNMPSPLGSNYRKWVTEKITAVVTHFRDNEHVIAWAVEGLSEWEVDCGNGDFREYLSAWYPDLAALNESWGTTFSDLEQVSMETVRQIDAGHPFGVGRASVDLAEYRRLAYHDILALWARTIKSLDSSRPLMTGPVTLYRSLTAIPPQYDIVCPATPPDELEPDYLTHNVHSVDMARRCGRFDVIPFLRVPLHQGESSSLTSWIAVAALHGARGVALDNWWALENSPAPHLSRQEVALALEASRPRETMRIVPQATMAFLYEPYVGGLSTGDCAPKRGARPGPRLEPTELQKQNLPAYGYIEGLLPGEPSNPFGAFRVGTQFGIADYITLQDAPGVDLQQYSAILAPMALRLSGALQSRLAQYVRYGGALVLDYGAGMYETGSWLSLPPAVAELCGILELVEPYEARGALTTTTWRPDWLHSLTWGMKTEGSYNSGAKRGTPQELRDYHVVGPACYAVLDSAGGAVATLDARTVQGKSTISGLLGRGTGSGLACYATHRLWANWRSDCPVYIGFHLDMCARRPAIDLQGTSFWTTGICATLTADGVALCNATRRATIAEVICAQARHAVHSSGAGLFSALARERDGTRSGAARLSVHLQAGETKQCRPLPILVQPYTDSSWAMALEVGPERIVLEVAGAGGDVVADRAGALSLTSGALTRARYTVTDGEYSVEPGSVHRVVMRTEGERLEGLFTATSEGRFRFSESARHGVITITPAVGESGQASE